MQRKPDDIVLHEEYERALELWPSEFGHLIRNANIVPRWLNDDSFWIQFQDDDGHRFLIIDAATGDSREAFDHQVVATALRSQGIEAQATALPLSHFELDDAKSAIVATTPAGKFHIDLASGALTREHVVPPTEIAGPGQQVVFLREHNLWLRTADGTERALTDDGQAFNAWGAGPDFNMRKVATNRGEAEPLPNAFWSPDGKVVLTDRIDERAVEPYPYIEYVPADGSPRPKLHLVRQALIGETPGIYTLWFINVETGVRTQVGPLLNDLWPRADLGTWWTGDGKRLLMAALSTSGQTAALVEIDIATGASRIVHQEHEKTFFDFNTYLYNSANVRLRHNEREAIWYSQKDGWGHLYAINLEDGSLRQLTQGPWGVADIILMTEDRLFFSAVGREAGRNPYYRHLYRVDLDGDAPNDGLILLTPDDADHGFPGEPSAIINRLLNRPAGLNQISPSGRFLIDAVSRVDLPPRFQLRDGDGMLIREIARADVSALEATGWQPPEIFTAKAADAETDLHGILLKPRGFDPARTYPVIEHIYGGPQLLAQPRSFFEGLNGAFLFGMNTLADLGFVVAILDGPGTPYRSKAFHDMTYGKADRWGVAHHRAALEGAGRSRPWMDLTRVGVRGHSFGGYGTVAALLHQPDFYKVGVSSAGMYDLSRAQASLASHFGRPDYGDGRSLKDKPDEVAANHLEMAPSRLAERLEGKLLLAVGDLDENIQPAGLFHFSDALIKAGKTFDLLVLPGRNHGFAAEPYFHKRTWDYFIEHLQGRMPQIHFMPKIRPASRMFI